MRSSDQPAIELNYTQATKLHKVMRDDYNEWLRGAPAAYRTPLFANGIPLVISIRYGQNVDIVSGNPDTLAVEAQNWKREHSYANILIFSLAIATHLTYVHCPFSAAAAALSCQRSPAV